MSKDELNCFVNIVNSYGKLDHLFSRILCSAGPTLAKEKASSLLTFSNNNRNLQDAWEEFKYQIKITLNIDFFELKKDKNSTIVLFYNKEKLKNIISEEKNIKFLKRFGYNRKMTLEECLAVLKNRFENVCPHEIGIFLGYPVDDVTLFIDCPDKKCKMIGYWKVYDDVESAQNIFSKYDKIKYNIINLMLQGIRPTEIPSYKTVWSSS